MGGFSILGHLAALGAAAVLALPASAQTGFPDRPITVIVHASPGGGTDVMTRMVFAHAGRLTGETFVIENHDGAGGQIGFTRLATSEPDGYTVGAITTMSIVTHELTREGVVYKLKESFQPIGQVVLDPSVVVVRADSPYTSFEELVAAAKEAPGKLNWGGTFLYGAHHVHYVLFNQATGAEMQYIPFDGVAETRAALLGGHIEVGAGGFSEWGALADSGEVRILVSAGSERWSDYPDVPTYGEFGHDIVLGSNRGFAVPAATPPERVSWLEKALADAVVDPEFLKEAEAMGMGPSINYQSADDFEAYLHDLQDTMIEILPPESLVQN